MYSKAPKKWTLSLSFLGKASEFETSRIFLAKYIAESTLLLVLTGVERDACMTRDAE
jgi:hypothetical protein